ncbi:hypothetical protein [Brevundimonas sp.]|uniref:hypothetical protein n=1 Tax=Brevundimonas sp. TaxID=1871086 RepID=UPI0026023753|nr:hypothetical protein [Brevundimonas sp.]
MGWFGRAAFVTGGALALASAAFCLWWSFVLSPYRESFWFGFLLLALGLGSLSGVFFAYRMVQARRWLATALVLVASIAPAPTVIGLLIAAVPPMYDNQGRPMQTGNPLE